MSVEQLRQVIDRVIEALRDFIDGALPAEPTLRPVPVPARRPQLRRVAR